MKDGGKLGELHEAVSELLLEKLKNGEASSSDIANTIRFLKDNGFTMQLEEKVQSCYASADSLPSIEDIEEMYK